jgi:hypothetical protein
MRRGPRRTNPFATSVTGGGKVHDWGKSKFRVGGRANTPMYSSAPVYFRSRY